MDAIHEVVELVQIPGGRHPFVPVFDDFIRNLSHEIGKEKARVP
jgi:hypothetical protein